MQLEDALQVSNEIAVSLGLKSVRRRRRRMRVAIGVAVTPAGIKVAVRARSRNDLDRAWGMGAGEAFGRLPSTELDIQITGQVAALPPSEGVAAASCLRPGASVGHVNATAGSLGFFARRKSDNAFGFVSNNHVLAECDYGQNGDEILHPARYDGGVVPKDVVATLAAPYPKLRDDHPVADAAFAVLHDRVDRDPFTITPTVRLDSSFIPPLFRQTEVLKTGRSTGTTYGRITAFHLQNLDVDYPPIGTVFLDRQIEIQAKQGRFSAPGDSGSLVVTPDGHPIGLLFAGSGGYSYVNPIEEVLHDLKVEFSKAG